MKSESDNRGGVAVIALNNDFFRYEDSLSAIAPVLQKNNKLVFDMNRVKFFDSTRCGVLLSCLKTLTMSGGDLKLCGVCKSVLTLFELLRIHRIVEIFNTREEAVRSFAD